MSDEFSVITERPASKYLYKIVGDTFSLSELISEDDYVDVDNSYYGDVLVKNGDDTFTAVKAGKCLLHFINNKQKYINVKQGSKATLSKTITKLTKKKTCAVRIRAYNVVGDETIYGQWSNVKTGKVK